MYSFGLSTFSLIPEKIRPVPATSRAVLAGYLGWMLDAFDFFTVVFLVGPLAAQFGVNKAAIVLTLTATLGLRPLGAFLFGLFADRYGRRRALMGNVLGYSLLALACGFSNSFGMFFALRALFGITMGGEWGVGAALALEAAPTQRRGLISGILQSGYPCGYLLAALAAHFLLPLAGWRAMFWAGGAPALLALYIRWQVPESVVWRQKPKPSTSAILRVLRQKWRSFLYLVLLMTMLMFLSHGTQDLYPDFLHSVHHFSSSTISLLAMLYSLAAIAGSVFFGHLSQSRGRRWGMIAALVLALISLPFWAYGGSLLALALGAMLMQAGVQGAWGVIPAHLNELAPEQARGLIPGLAYQLGILIAAPTNTLEYALRGWVGYRAALAGFELVVIAGCIAAIAGSPERKGIEF